MWRKRELQREKIISHSKTRTHFISLPRLALLSYIYTRQPTNPRPMPTNFYGLVRYDRIKITRSNLKAYLFPINTHCTRAVSALFPWCTHAQIPLFPTYPRPSGLPIPTVHVQPRPILDTTTLTALNIGPTPICMLDFHSRSQMNNSSKCNANRHSFEGSVPEMRIWPILLIKFDLKLCIHLGRSLFLYLLYLQLLCFKTKILHM